LSTEQYRRRREAAHRSLDASRRRVSWVSRAQEPALAYRDLLRGFAELPQDQRAMLLLIGVQDFSYGEAAQILAIPIGTVMSRLSRGRERLRRYINEGPASGCLRKPGARLPFARDLPSRNSAAGEFDAVRNAATDWDGSDPIRRDWQRG
jgi:Sigma-70, region 4